MRHSHAQTTAPARNGDPVRSGDARLPRAGSLKDELMVVPVVEIEPLETQRSATSSSAQRFSPADFCEPEAALFEVDLADHVVVSARRDLAAPATEPAR